MSKDGLSFDFSRHNAAFQRMALTSKKDLPTLWREECRIAFGGSGSMPGIAGITPPYGAGGLQGTRAAETHAKAKVAADIYDLYGDAGDAYDVLHQKNPAQADAYWWLYKKQDIAGANQVLRAETGSILYPFDDGAHHRKNFRRGTAKRGRGFRFYVTDPKNLKAYVQLEQEMVWWLAAGWLEPLEALKAKVPAGIKKHAAPGHLKVIMNDDILEIGMSNDVSYGRAIKDMKRRMETVLNEYRTARLDRMWERYLEHLAGKGGLKLS